MPPRSISPASAADQNAEHLQEEPKLNHAATLPPPPPPRDIYATLASTLAPMDAKQYYQSIQGDLRRTTRPSMGGSRRKGTTTSGARRKTFSGKTPGKAPWTPSWKRQPKSTPPRPGTSGTASTPS